MTKEFDWKPIIEGWERAFTMTREAFEEMNRALRHSTGAMQRLAANDEIRLAGLWGRYFVRGGHATQVDLDATVFSILRGDEEPFLTPESRGFLASAMIRGWTSQHPEEIGPIAWHRLLGDTRVQVGSGT